MDTKKTLRYNWEFGRETVAIRVSSYRNNGNLYVGLCHKEGRDWEDFGDVTINLPLSLIHIYRGLRAKGKKCGIIQRYRKRGNWLSHPKCRRTACCL